MLVPSRSIEATTDSESNEESKASIPTWLTPSIESLTGKSISKGISWISMEARLLPNEPTPSSNDTKTGSNGCNVLIGAELVELEESVTGSKWSANPRSSSSEISSFLGGSVHSMVGIKDSVGSQVGSLERVGSFETDGMGDSDGGSEGASDSDGIGDSEGGADGSSDGFKVVIEIVGK